MTTTQIKGKVRDLLLTDPRYILLLGDPTTQPFQTYYLRPPDPPTFPQVVYWMGNGEYDQEVGRDLLRSRRTLTFRTYSKDTKYEDLADRIKRIMQHATSSGFRCILNTENELYEDDWDVYSMAITFDLRYRRARTEA